MELVSRTLRERIESHLGSILHRALGMGATTDSNDSASRSPLVETIRQFVLAGGKRIRPQLSLWTYEHARDTDGAGALPEIAMDVACAWELFHAFLLCHDDIIDGANRRRQEPTLHHRLALLDGGSMIFGANLGIVAGDLLFVGSMRLLHEMDLESAQPPLTVSAYQQLLRLFSRVACETGFGQAVDIVQSHVPIGAVDERTVLQGYHWKTAAYTFEGPMLSGATLAGLNEAGRNAVSRFSLAIGQAYQLHNDVLDLLSESHDGCDLVQGKRTPTLLRARQVLGSKGRQEFDERVEAIKAGGPHAVALAEVLRVDLLQGGAVDRTRDVIADLLAEARAATDDDALSPGFSSALTGLLAGLTAKYFAPALAT